MHLALTQILGELLHLSIIVVAGGRFMKTHAAGAHHLTGSGQTETAQNGGGGTIPPVPAGPGGASGPRATDGNPLKDTPPGTLARFAQPFRRRPTTTLGADDCLTYDQLKELRARVRSSENVTDEVAEELSAALQRAERIRSENLYIAGAYDQLTFIVDCLLAAKPLLILARDERLNLQLEIYRREGLINRTLARMSSGSPVGFLLSALFIAFILWFVVITGITGLRYLVQAYKDTYPALAHLVFIFMDPRAFAVITSAAFIGGILSIATRLNEFSRVRDLDPFAMFWTAMLKPLIGVILSVFILAALEGDVVSFAFLKDPLTTLSTIPLTAPLTDSALKVLYVLWVLGFLAGFSERFAWDFVGRTQGVASGSPSGEKTSGEKK